MIEPEDRKDTWDSSSFDPRAIDNDVNKKGEIKKQQNPNKT
jgi:hypothetical protein